MLRLGLLLLTLLAGCGGPPGAPPLVDGTGVFLVRFNPPGCLASRPELHVEVKTPQGWERVAVEAPAEDELDLVAPLMSRFQGDPYAEVRIEARFTSGRLTFVGGHVSRVLRIISLDPPPAT